jgi:hypothetical protein
MFADHDVKLGRLRADPGPGRFAAGMNARSVPGCLPEAAGVTV